MSIFIHTYISQLCCPCFAACEIKPFSPYLESFYYRHHSPQWGGEVPLRIPNVDTTQVVKTYSFLDLFLF